MSVAVGKDVEASCRKCGEVWHVIVTMAAGVITKVQCKECGGNHKYKPPAGEERVDAVAAKKKPTTVRKTAKRKATKKGASKLAPGQLPDAPLVDPDLSRPVRDYDVGEVFELGDRVDHPRFGHGVVEKITGPGKISIFFESGRKTLAHNR